MSTGPFDHVVTMYMAQIPEDWMPKTYPPAPNPQTYPMSPPTIGPKVEIVDSPLKALLRACDEFVKDKPITEDIMRLRETMAIVRDRIFRGDRT